MGNWWQRLVRCAPRRPGWLRSELMLHRCRLSCSICREVLASAASEADRLTLALAQLRAEYAELTGLVVETRETAILQEAGIYQYRHRCRTPSRTRPAWRECRLGSKMP